MVIEVIAIIVALISGFLYFRARRDNNQTCSIISLLFFFPSMIVIGVNGIIIMPDIIAEIGL